jgi:hypothetical protein
MVPLEKNRPPTWLIGIGVLLVVIGLTYYLAQPKGSDADQINADLKSAVAASKSGQAGSVLDLLSRAFEVNGAHPAMADVAQAIRRYKPECDVEPGTLSVSGDDATMESQVRVHGALLGSGFDTTIKQVRLDFRREGTLAWGVVPIRAWRLRSINVDGPLPDDLPLSGWIRDVGSF